MKDFIIQIQNYKKSNNSLDKQRTFVINIKSRHDGLVGFLGATTASATTTSFLWWPHGYRSKPKRKIWARIPTEELGGAPEYADVLRLLGQPAG